MAALSNMRRSFKKSEYELDSAGKMRDAGFKKAVDTYQGVRDEYRPYMDIGRSAVSLFENPSSITSNPGYQFRMNQGTQAIENSAAAKGGLFSGNTLLELTKFGQDYASAEYDKEVGRRMQVGMFGVQGYDAASLNSADLLAGQGQAAAKTAEDKARLYGAKAQWAANFFDSWMSGDGVAGDLTKSSMGSGQKKS